MSSTLCRGCHLVLTHPLLIAKLLFDLGLLKTPSVDQILAIASSPDAGSKRTVALRYFLDEYAVAGFGATCKLQSGF